MLLDEAMEAATVSPYELGYAVLDVRNERGDEIDYIIGPELMYHVAIRINTETGTSAWDTRKSWFSTIKQWEPMMPDHRSYRALVEFLKTHRAYVRQL